MDKQVRNQMIGAFVWFVALVALSGYLQPVSYDPLQHVDQAYDPDYRSPLERLFTVEDNTATSSEAEAESPDSEETSGETVQAQPAVRDKADELLAEQKKGKLTYDAPIPKGWVLRLASFRKRQLADQLFSKVKEAGYNVRVHPFVNSKKQRWYAVDIVQLKSQAQARALKRKLDRRFRVKGDIFEQK